VNVQLPCFSQGQKNNFNEFECLYLTIHKVEIFEIFITCSQISILQDPTVTCVKKRYFFQKFGTCTRNGSDGAFLVKIKKPRNLKGQHSI